MIELIKTNSQRLTDLCEKHSVAELYIFGSAVSDAFTDKSDLDFAVLFKDSLSPLEHGDAFFGLKDDLENLFEKQVDLISYRVVKNPVFKSQLDRTKIQLYAA